LGQSRFRTFPAGRPWLLALGSFVLGAALLLLPIWIAQGHIESSSLIDVSLASPWFAVVAAGLGLLMLLTPRADVAAIRHISAISLVAACVAYMQFAQTLWVRFDLRTAAKHIAELQRAGIPVAHFQVYENQFQYLGRLQQQLDIVIGGTL